MSVNHAVYESVVACGGVSCNVGTVQCVAALGEICVVLNVCSVGELMSLCLLYCCASYARVLSCVLSGVLR